MEVTLPAARPERRVRILRRARACVPWAAAVALLASLAPSTADRASRASAPRLRPASAPIPIATDLIPVVRPVYRYSVVHGGTYNAEELKDDIRGDPVVARHYSGFDTGTTQVVELREDLSAHVSYRIGDRVYWTKNRLRLSRGEKLLSDGRELARTRCGNRVSLLPETPTSEDEPPAEDFDTTIAGPADESTVVAELFTNEFPTLRYVPTIDEGILQPETMTHLLQPPYSIMSPVPYFPLVSPQGGGPLPTTEMVETPEAGSLALLVSGLVGAAVVRFGFVGVRTLWHGRRTRGRSPHPCDP